ncbi:MAG: hypothetical protein AB7H93_12110 [Vicinamibacterales bacterium]
MGRISAATVVAVMIGWVGAAHADAQVIGTFNWQLQPYCNRIFVTVTQGPSSYQLSGYEDQCGATRRAPLVGTAVLNPDGTVQFGISLTPPASRPVNVSATINLGDLNGTWSDGGGNGGALVFNAAAPGNPRPAAGTGELIAHAFVNRSSVAFGFSYGFSAVSRPQTGLYCVTPVLPAGLTVADVYPHVTVEWNLSAGSDLFAYGQLSTGLCPDGVAVRTFQFVGSPVAGVTPSNGVGFFVTLYRR